MFNKNYKMGIKLLMFILIILIQYSSYANAYEIFDNWDDDYAYFETIYDYNEIVNDDMYVMIYANLVIVPNYTGYHHNLNIYLRPWERLDQLPIADLKIHLCNDEVNYGWFHRKENYCSNQFDIKNITKSSSTREFLKSGDIKLYNYSIYIFNITNKINLSVGNRMVIIIEYTLPDSISNQGDFYFVNFHYPNMRKINKDNFVHYLLLPSKDSIPDASPEDAIKDKVAYTDYDKWYYKWSFKFKGNEDRIFSYYNLNEVQKKQEELQSRYTWKGIKWGLFFAILLLLIERLFFDWTSFGNQIFQKIVGKFNPKFVVGNKENKVYHNLNCPYINNIKKQNREIFKDFRQARSKNLTPCKFCNNL